LYFELYLIENSNLLKNHLRGFIICHACIRRDPAPVVTCNHCDLFVTYVLPNYVLKYCVLRDLILPSHEHKPVGRRPRRVIHSRVAGVMAYDSIFLAMPNVLTAHKTILRWCGFTCSSATFVALLFSRIHMLGRLSQDLLYPPSSLHLFKFHTGALT
jgi:hypothetical protein